MAQDPSQAVKAPGNAPIVKQGQTTNGQFGSDPNKQPKGRQPARDLTVK
jgi:hypothetical protein